MVPSLRSELWVHFGVDRMGTFAKAGTDWDVPSTARCSYMLGANEFCDHTSGTRNYIESSTMPAPVLLRIRGALTSSVTGVEWLCLTAIYAETSYCLRCYVKTTLRRTRLALQASLLIPFICSLLSREGILHVWP